MIFTNIREYLNFKTHCPFCDHRLTSTIDSLWVKTDNENISEVKFENDVITFNHTSSYCYDITRTPNNPYYKSIFEIKLYLDSSKVTFTTIDTDIVPMKGYIESNPNRRFIGGFNDSKIIVHQECNICDRNYLVSSSSLLLNNNGELLPILVNREYFNADKYRCVNYYLPKSMSIYTREEYAKEVINTEFIDLNQDTSNKIDDKIPMIVLFS